jgi:excinuclease ABC subunit C
MRDETARIVYVGKAQDIAKRVASYFMDRDHHTAKIDVLVSTIRHIDYIPTASERDALLVERSLIKQLQPHYNTVWRDDKSYPYVKISIQDQCPEIYLTRRKQDDGSVYFGPFTNVKPIRKLLRFLWDKPLFAIRPGRAAYGARSQFTAEESAQCRRIAQEIILFFRGHYKPLLKKWREEMAMASQALDYERAAQLRDNLEAIEHMHERVTVRQVNVEEIESHVDRTRAITDLQKALGMALPPLRIECFDISHIQGLEPVASMVFFENGQPKKSEYRKFKIKTVQGIDDFASMAEVVGRRYRRLLAEGKSLPNLILIDGGKGQLSSACTALHAALGRTYSKLCIASLAKREEELFLPDRSEPIRLPLDSPASLLVQYVRNEAHRFAITFHRQRRAKRFIQGKGVSNV